MKLSGISVSVSNLEESVKFYTENLGFNYFDTVQTGLGRQAILTSGNMRVSLFETNKIPNGKIFDMSFLSKDIDKDVAELEDKGLIIKKPAGQGSIAKVAHFEDPDGVDIALVEWNEGFEETKDQIRSESWD